MAMNHWSSDIASLSSLRRAGLDLQTRRLARSTEQDPAY